MEGVRRGAAAIYKFLIAIFAAAVVVQIFFAGAGIFRGLPDEGESTTYDRFEDTFEPHFALGFFLFLGSILLLILILIAWTGPRSIGATFGLLLLVFMQFIWAGIGGWAGGLHAANALLILALSLFLAWRAWRGNLLTPPSRLGAASPPPPAPAA
jgi:Family of unknown function (DUF6220)